jgi:hypothetical protein
MVDFVSRGRRRCFPQLPVERKKLGGKMYRTERRILRLGLLCLAFSIAGCGPYVHEVRYPETGATLEGSITYGKEKVGAALVIAQNQSGSATAFVDDNGHFKLENVPLGDVNIGVNTDAGKGQAMGRLTAQSQGKAQGSPKLIDIPARFANPATSGLKTTIQKGANTFDILITQ